MSLRQIGGVGHIAPPYTPGIEIVTFAWSNTNGHCEDCGLPAAFYLPEAYINREKFPDAPPQQPTDTNKRCAVCAANAAAEGDVVRRISHMDDEPDEGA